MTSHRPRSKRANRGANMHKLIDAADEEFWNQEFFQDAANDEEFSSVDESEGAFNVDDDFFDSEHSDGLPTPDEGAMDARKKKRKRVSPSNRLAEKKTSSPSLDLTVLPPEWQARCATLGSWRARQLRKFCKKHDIDVELVPTARLVLAIHAAILDWHAQGKPLPEMEDDDDDDDSEEVLSVRQSTKRKTQAARSHAERMEAERARRREKHRLAAAQNAKNQAPPLTQEQILKEAEKTEELNRTALKRLMDKHDRDRERRIARARRPPLVGPVVRTVSNAQGTHVSFTDASILPVHQTPRPAQRSTCVHTGLPAKYRDAKSGLPLANLAAFQRQRKAEVTLAHAQAMQKIDQLNQLLIDCGVEPVVRGEMK